MGTKLYEKRPQWGIARIGAIIAIALLSVLSSACLAASPAPAFAEPYGEVTRFGGYDATGSTPGKIVAPVGFAVEPEDPTTGEKNDVYVLDRTVDNSTTGELDYRLQKLSSTGVPLGSTTIAETYTNKKTYAEAHPLAYLAVDPERGRVYSIVQAVVKTGEEQYRPVVDEVVAWSTQPNAAKEITRADPGEYAEDSITKASLVAGEATLKPASLTEVLFAPSGIVADASAGGSDGDVVLEAQKGVKGAAGGITTLQAIITEGSNKGTLGESRTVGTNAMQAGGIFAEDEGADSLGTSLYRGMGDKADFVTVPLDFAVSEETELAQSSDEENNDFDEAAAYDMSSRPNIGGSGLNALNLVAPGAPIASFAYESRRLYAAIYQERSQGGPLSDSQSNVEPWRAAAGGEASDWLWLEGGASDKEWANEGVRLFEADGHIVDTIGSGRPTAPPNAEPTSLIGSCAIDFAAGASVVAGADGVLFVLVKSNAGYAPPSGDEVIEFAPGGTHTCPSMSGDIEVNGKEVKPEAGQPMARVTVSAGVATKFNAISLDPQIGWTPAVEYGAGGLFGWGHAPFEWQPYSFEWNFGEEADGGPTFDSQTGPPEYLWPSPEATFTYQTLGDHEAKVTVYSDLGVKSFPVAVHVKGKNSPVAAFECPAEIKAGMIVSCDASKSTPTEETEIENYHWEFIEDSSSAKSVADSDEPLVKHTFVNAGKYEVVLTIKDTEGTPSEVTVTHSVTVVAETKAEEEAAAKKKAEEEAAAKKKAEEEAAAKKKAEEEAAAKKKAEEEAARKKKTQPVVESRRQKLAKALRTCHKDKAKKKRAACEKRARKRYAAPNKKKATNGKDSKK